MKPRPRRLYVVTIALTFALLAAACGDDNGEATDDAGGGKTKKVTLSLDFAVDGLHAPFFVAKEKGCFENEGLDVDIQPGQGSSATVKVVGAGQAQFGLADAGTVVKSIGDDVPVKAVGVLLERTPAVVVAKKDSGITEPADLEGKSYGDAEEASTGVLFPAFLAANELAEGDVRFVGMTFPARVPALQGGQVDTIGGYIQEFVNIQDEVNFIPWAENGIESYGTSIIASNKVIEDDPDLVRSFLAGAACGFDAMNDSSEEAAKITAEAGEGDPEYFSGELELLEPYFANGSFEMKEDRWDATQDLMVEFGGLKSELPADDVWTNEFLES